ncbi:MAG: hypothetical protein ACOX3V_01945 [Bacillota bacterium]|jgi:hypothetical protein
MSDLQGLSLSDMSRILKVPVSLVRVMVDQARTVFKDAMARKKCALLVDSGPCCVCEGARELGSEESLRLRQLAWRNQNRGGPNGRDRSQADTPSLVPDALDIVAKMLRTLSVTEMFIPWENG